MVVSRSSAKKQTPIEKFKEDVEKVDPAQVDPTKDPKRAAEVAKELGALMSRAETLKKQFKGEFEQAHAKLDNATADLEKKGKLKGWFSAATVNVSVGSGWKFNFLEKPLGKRGHLYTETVQAAENFRKLEEINNELQTRKKFIDDTLATLPLDLDALGDGGKPPSDATLKKLEDEAKKDHGVVTGDRGEIIHAELIPKAVAKLHATDAKLKKVWEQALARVNTKKNALDDAEADFRKAYPGIGEQRELPRAHAQGREVPKKAAALLNRINEREIELHDALVNETPLVKKLQGLRELVAVRIKGTNDLNGPSHHERLAETIAQQVAGTAQGALQQKLGSLDRLNTVNPYNQAPINPPPVDQKKIMEPYLADTPDGKPQ